MYFCRIVSLLVFCASFSFLSAQDDVELSKRSELKLNALYLLLGGLELDYEHILNEESSLGVSATYFFDDEVEYRWGLTPHYRLFFGNKPALGFFVEGNAALFGFEDVESIIFDQNGMVTRITEDVETKFGMGIAVGGKFKSKRDIVVEVTAGLGRLFTDNSDVAAYPRLGINVGKRF